MGLFVSQPPALRKRSSTVRYGRFEVTQVPGTAAGRHARPLAPGRVGYRSGPLMASSDSLKSVVKGRQTHGARPWGGVDPIVL